MLEQEGATVEQDPVAEPLGVGGGDGPAGHGLVGLSSVLTLDGVTVTGTVPAVERGWGGYGILLTDRDVNVEGYPFPGHEGASARLDGVTLAGNAEAGLVVDAVSAELSDVTIGSTNAGLGEGGDGAVVLRGGVLDAADVVTTGNQRASLLFDGSSGSLQVASGDEPIGLVQQACDGVEPLGGSAWSFAAVHLCDGEVLPIAYTPLAWSNDVDVQP